MRSCIQEKHEGTSWRKRIAQTCYRANVHVRRRVGPRSGLSGEAKRRQAACTNINNELNKVKTSNRNTCNTQNIQQTYKQQTNDTHKQLNQRDGKPLPGRRRARLRAATAGSHVHLSASPPIIHTYIHPYIHIYIYIYVYIYAITH